MGKKLDYLHLKDFLKYECELYLNEADFVLEYPLYNSIRDKFQSKFEKGLGSLKFFFQLDQ